MTGRFGIEHNGVTVTVEHFPSYKKPALVVTEGNVMTKVASFDSENAAEWFLLKMQKLFNIGEDV